MPQGVKIVIIAEGATESAFRPFLIKFLTSRLKDKMPKIRMIIYNGSIPKEDKLKRIVKNLLSGKDSANYVIALTDVYTGSTPHLFENAADAKEKMREWVGEENRFFPHAAQYDFEAWLLVYWNTIQKLARHKMSSPGVNPEKVNHDKPPAYWLREIFRIGKRGGRYVKPIDAARILRENEDNLLLSINSCPELKALVNNILRVCGGEVIL